MIKKGGYMCILNRENANKFYILYRRHLPKNDTSCKFAIYRSVEFGNDYFGEYRTLREAKKVFNKVTKQAEKYQFNF
jgi:hypothetical protein